MLSFLEELLSSTDGQQDGFRITTIIKTQIHSSLKVPNQKCLAYQTICVLIQRGQTAVRLSIVENNDNMFSRCVVGHTINDENLPHDTGIWKLEFSFGVWLKKSEGETEPEVLASATSSALW